MKKGFMKNHYDVLGVARNASQDEIKTAYWNMAKQYHPDRNHAVGCEELLKDINEAHTILSDERRRKDYDSTYFKAGVQGPLSLLMWSYEFMTALRKAVNQDNHIEIRYPSFFWFGADFLKVFMYFLAFLQLFRIMSPMFSLCLGFLPDFLSGFLLLVLCGFSARFIVGFAMTSTSVITFKEGALDVLTRGFLITRKDSIPYSKVRTFTVSRMDTMFCQSVWNLDLCLSDGRTICLARYRLKKEDKARQMLENLCRRLKSFSA